MQCLSVAISVVPGPHPHPGPGSLLALLPLCNKLPWKSARVFAF